MSVKNPLIPAGIEPATYQFVAQQLNHSATGNILVSEEPDESVEELSG